MVHGSDFPVPVHGHFHWLRGFLDWRTFRRWERDPNVLERDYQMKVAMGFAPETFTRIATLLRAQTRIARLNTNQPSTRENS
jgi:hypothetical protein